MTHACGCHTDFTVDTGHDVAPAGPDDTVGDVVRRRAGGLQILKEMGINHGCGAHLTLREAAAAAGVSIDALLAALGGVRKASA